MLKIEVVYAEAHRQRRITLELPAGSSVGDALGRAVDQWRLELPEDSGVGIFGEKVDLERLLKAGDRVEIYRPLILDPKEARRQRAQKQEKEQVSR